MAHACWSRAAGTGRRTGAARSARTLALGAAAVVLRKLRPGLASEERLLRWSWASHPADSLDAYLVVGWQNPRINVQSILIRHELIRRLFGDGGATAS